jgi:hypothetical protein
MNVMPAAKVVAGALTEAELAECGLARMAQRKRVRAVTTRTILSQRRAVRGTG